MERKILTAKEIEQIYAGKYQIMEGVGAPEIEIKSNAKFTPPGCDVAKQ